MKISAEHVKNLREMTGASIMECREALQAAGGNVEKAIENLRKRGREKAAKKAGRETCEGTIGSYLHSNKKIGAIVELFCETDFVAKNAEFQDFAHDLAMHISALDPKYLSFDQVPKHDIAEYENFARDEIQLEKKPAEIVEKIIRGKIRKYFEEKSLLSQPFVKNPDLTIDDLLKEKVLKIGENIRIGNFCRFEI